MPADDSYREPTLPAIPDATGDEPEWRRRLLGLPTAGALTEEAVRAAYWRLVGRLFRDQGGDSPELSQLKAAKQQLLFDLGVRIPNKRSGDRRDHP